MQEKIKGYLGKVVGWWKAAGKKVKLFLIAGLIAVVAVVAVVLAMQMNLEVRILKSHSCIEQECQ